MTRSTHDATELLDHTPASAPAPAPGKRTMTQGMMPRPILFRVESAEAARELGLAFGRRDGNGVAEHADAAVDRAATSSGEPLRADLRARFESSLGADLSGVRVHRSADSAAANDAVGARAYTVGADIHFGAGQYQPDDPFGLHLLAHEVAHTQQQAGAAPTRQHKLEVSTPGDAAELEADRAADAMVSGAAFTVTGAPIVAARAPAEGKAGAKGYAKGGRDVVFGGDVTIFHVKKAWGAWVTTEVSFSLIGEVKISPFGSGTVGGSRSGGSGANTKDGKTSEEGFDASAKYDAEVKEKTKQNAIDRFMQKHDVKSAKFTFGQKSEQAAGKTKEKTAGTLEVTMTDGTTRSMAVEGVKDGKLDVGLKFAYTTPIDLPEWKISGDAKATPSLKAQIQVIVTPNWSSIFKSKPAGPGEAAKDGKPKSEGEGEKPAEGEGNKPAESEGASEPKPGEPGGEPAPRAGEPAGGEPPGSTAARGAGEAAGDGAADGAAASASEGAGGRGAASAAAASLEVAAAAAIAASVVAALAIGARDLKEIDDAKRGAAEAAASFASGGVGAFGVQRGSGSGSQYANGLNYYNSRFFALIQKLKDKCADQKPSTADCAWAIRGWAKDHGEALYGAIYSSVEKSFQKRYADELYQKGHCDPTEFDSDARRNGESVGPAGWEAPEGRTADECQNAEDYDEAAAAEARGEARSDNQAAGGDNTTGGSAGGEHNDGTGGGSGQ